jgi:hypothetical protein
LDLRALGLGDARQRLPTLQAPPADLAVKRFVALGQLLGVPTSSPDDHPTVSMPQLVIMAMLVDTGDTETGSSDGPVPGHPASQVSTITQSWRPAWQPKEDEITNRSIIANHEIESA